MMNEDYDCYYCPRHFNNGGSCHNWEYECPYSIIKQYNSEQLRLIRKIIKTIYEAIGQLEKIDTEGYMESDIGQVRFQLLLLENQVSKATEEEWNRVK